MLQSRSNRSGSKGGLAGALTAAEPDGLGGHGIRRPAFYAAQAKSGEDDDHGEFEAVRWCTDDWYCREFALALARGPGAAAKR